MKRTIEIGEVVSFTMNTGNASRGKVVQRIAERRQPVILLIEQANGWRCFRLEDEVKVVETGSLVATALDLANGGLIGIGWTCTPAGCWAAGSKWGFVILGRRGSVRAQGWPWLTRRFTLPESCMAV